MTRTVAYVFGLALVAAILVPAAVAITVPMTKPAIEMKSNLAGKKVIATPTRHGIYFWDKEKAAGGKIQCTGACLKTWPVVYVDHMVAKHVKGVMATFGAIKRGSKYQLTVNGLPAYTFAGDTAGVVKCDGVDGWHAVRAG
jgi:predicted lipoprotein with Yx(FWY)xxD motif